MHMVLRMIICLYTYVYVVICVVYVTGLPLALPLS